MKKTIIICSSLFLAFLVLTCSILFVRDRNVNACFYSMKKNIIEEFEYVNHIEMANFGPHCGIRICVNDGNDDYDSIEPVFIKAMTEMSKEENLQYLKERHARSASGEMAFLHVYFCREDGEELYRFRSYKDFDVWELERDRSVQFRVSDYLQ